LLFLSSLSAYYLGKDEELVSQRIGLGRAVQPSDLAYLMIQADPAFVTWLQVPDQEASAPPEFPAVSDRVMYLGHSNNVAVVHDPRRLRTWRVPESKAMVSILAPSTEPSDAKSTGFFGSPLSIMLYVVALVLAGRLIHRYALRRRQRKRT
jgi:hypothetical protein